MPTLATPKVELDAIPPIKRSPDAWALQRWPDSLGNGVRLPERFLLAGAKAHCHWVDGDLITEQQFDEGWEAFATLPVGR